ncbi:ferrochelatase [Cellvibrio sp. OA-2007]|uniref:ferrochelatase n=1 Tax=Cellvibrio sp. OA-2007 TaxID=529823 RepID=UPI0007854FAC|nr:ferrochelatase [Cellvibrio sp. OA-2007]
MNQFRALNYDVDPVFHSANRPAAKVGLLLTNLGTPDAPNASALRRYLREFLSDPRVIEIPRLAWMFILHCIILRVRPKKSAKLYQSVWTSEGSPLLVISKQQQQAIQVQLGDGFSVKLGMRYGNPSIASALRELQSEGVRKIIVLPLYPQYAAPTTGSSFDAVAKELSIWRWVPELHFINNYCDQPLYIDALANSVREHIEKNGKPQKILFSYHGMPKRNLDLGDPYYCLCIKTTRLVAEKLGLNKDDYMACFQSRFGYAEWLKPYTDETLKSLPAEGIKNIAILSPAFSADCLETLEELAVENRHTFIEAGGEKYDYIPALNDRADHIEALVQLVKSKVCSQASV